MKVLVTGASGFIGQRVVQSLVAQGKEVVTVGRRPCDAVETQFIECDLLQNHSLHSRMERAGATHLIHLAWNATPGIFWTASDNLDWVAASLRLLRAFQDCGGIRAVFAGSCAEYCWTGDAVLDENSSAMVPATLYGTAKDSLRRLACSFAQQSGLSFAWARIFWLYGPGEPMGKLVPDIISALKAGRPVDVSEGRQKRDFLHVDDVAEAFVRALDSRYDGPFNIGSGVALPVRDIVSTLAAALSREDLIRFGARPTPKEEPSCLQAAVHILHDQIGFIPRYTLESGLTETVRWWNRSSGAIAN